VAAAAPGSHLVVGVVGAGTMGGGIAQVVLEAGYEVRLFDVDAAAVERAIERIRAGLSRRAAREMAVPHETAMSSETAAPNAGGSLTERVGGILAHLSTPRSLDGVAAGADIVIEAALEDLAAKRAVFAALDEASASALLATNTSALSVTAIAAATLRRGRVLGLHFFNPAPVMPLVEVVAAGATDEAVIDDAMSLVMGMGKTPVRAADAPGFIVNRVNRPFTLEPLGILGSGRADIRSIDSAIRAAGFPMGPFELIDLVGIDVNLATTRAIHEGFAAEDGSERFRPSPIQESLMAAGRLGRKTGRGFYEYDAEGRPDRPVEEMAPTADPLSAEVVVDRVLVAIAAEACRAAAAEVASPEDIDRAMRLGASHPAGPFEWIASIGGPAELSRRLARYRALGPRFAVPPGLD
jgi:3-hydroxybutyryl-CoA dehydrogenase